MTNKGLHAFGREALVPFANLIVEPGEWYASPCHDAQGNSAAAVLEDEEEEDLIVHRKECSASEVAVALAHRMLSGKVHEELEIVKKLAAVGRMWPFSSQNLKGLFTSPPPAI